jgi:hypothetical protein
MSKKSLYKPLYVFPSLVLMALVLTARPARVGASAHRIDQPPDATGKDFIAVPLKQLYFPYVINEFAPTPLLGTVAGSVTLRYTGEPILGVRVCVMSTNQCDTTDQDGLYAISNIPIGAQTIRAVAGGYHQQDQHVQILPNQTVLLGFVLDPVMITITISFTTTPPTATMTPPCRAQNLQCGYEILTPVPPTLTATPPPP